MITAVAKKSALLISALSQRAFALTLILFASLSAMTAMAEEEDCSNARQFTFSWQFADQCNMQARGGTSRGTAVTLATGTSPDWQALKEEGISLLERDRRAILAMAGPYRTSFDFLEVVGYQPDYEPVQPYQSWATEYVYVLEDSETLISLQHIIVMFIQNEDEVVGPIVTKHWRQDWAYEKPNVLAYIGNQTWQTQPVPEAELAGSWSQAVYQVDDSPRYESWGHWEHNPSFSTWQSATTWRPLPRRESSVRDDYQVLEGTNRHTILPNGWLHEESNSKLAIDEDGKPASNPYVAKELGVNRYERIVDHDFSGGDEYQDKTGDFWADVRAAWNTIIADREYFTLNLEDASVPMFLRLFEAAEQFSGENYNADESREQIRQIIDEYLEE